MGLRQHTGPWDDVVAQLLVEQALGHALKARDLGGDSWGPWATGLENLEPKPCDLGFFARDRKKGVIACLWFGAGGPA